jgi:hypothetical protein
MAIEKSTSAPEPRADRPRMPKDYGVPQDVEGMLPWRWAEERLEQAKNYWVVTVRPDGRPHAVPVWGAWVDRRFYFDGGGVKAANLASNPAATVHLEDGTEVVIVEGVYDKAATPDADLFARIRDSYGAKYDYRPETPGQLFTIRPRVVLAWQQFPRDATRWRFGKAQK